MEALRSGTQCNEHDAVVAQRLYPSQFRLPNPSRNMNANAHSISGCRRQPLQARGAGVAVTLHDRSEPDCQSGQEPRRRP